MLNDDVAEVRVEAIRTLKALSAKGDDRVVEMLIERLEDSAKEVRNEAVATLKLVARIDDEARARILNRAVCWFAGL